MTRFQPINEVKTALAEKLRSELIRFSFDLPASRRLGEANFSHVASMIRAANKLFVSVGPTGEFYVLDESGWRRIYQWPNKDPINNWRGTFFGHCYWSAQNVVVFAGFAKPEPPYGNALVFIDPDTLEVSTLGLGGGSFYELFACIEKDGKLYVTGEYDHAGFYEFTDKNAFKKLSTVPAGLTGHANPRALTYFNGNFVVAEEHGQAVFRSPDGVTWTKIMDTPDRLYALTTDGSRVLVAGTNKVYYVNSDWTYGVAFRLPDYSGMYNFVRSCLGWGLVGSANRYGVFIVNPIQEFYFTFNPQLAYMTPYSGIADVEQYGGKLFIGGVNALWDGHPTKESQPGFIEAINMHEPFKLYPLTFTPWSSTSISAGAETDPIPMLGYSSALIYFLSNAAGTLTILVDMNGNGDWQTYDTVSNVSANTPVWYPLGTTNFARLKLSFSAAATVTAKIFLR
jgi:hypothetical protein